MLLQSKLAGLAIALGLFAASANAQVDGTNAQLVDASDANGSLVATFRNMGNGTWLESGHNGGNGPFTFQESGRDQWSVYLHDSSRGIDIQLDMYQRQVNFRSSYGGNWSPLYNVLDARSGPTGRLVNNVTYQFGNGAIGYFRQVDQVNWVECNSDGQNNFEELRRDDWSVYMIDRARNIFIQIDLYSQVVRIGYGNEAYQFIYQIDSAQ